MAEDDRSREVASEGPLAKARRALPRTSSSRALAGAAVLSALVLATVFASSLVLGASSDQTLTTALVSLAAVLSLAIFVGNTGVLSFGHVAFMALGAYVSGLLTMPPAIKAQALPDLPPFLASAEVSPIVAALVGAALVAVVAAGTGVLIGRLSAGAGVIATLALLIIVHVILVGWSDLTRGNQPLYGVPRSLSLPFAAGVAVMLIFVSRLFASSRPGLRTRATREDESAAAAVGVGVLPHRLSAWVASAVGMALAGSMFAHLITAFSPQALYISLTLTLLTMLIVGGLYSVTGAVVGTALVTALVEILRRLETGFSLGPAEIGPTVGLTDVGLAVAILLAMRFRPDGLLGYHEIEDRLPWRHLGASTDALAPAVHSGIPACNLTADGITHRFDGVTALDDIAIRLRSGEILGLIGPNGSGKSTLLAVLSGVLAPSSGSVRLQDRDITGLPSQRVARLGVGRTFQSIRLFDHLTVLENVTAALVSGDRASRPRRPEATAWGLLARFGIAGLASSRAATLSYGDQRRLEIARALATRPRLLLLDEPAAGMNHEETDRLLALLQAIRDEYELGLLVVDHDMRLMARLCERMVVLDHGQRIAAGKPTEVLRDPRVAELYLRSAERTARTGRERP